jgi:MFS family permease
VAADADVSENARPIERLSSGRLKVTFFALGTALALADLETSIVSTAVAAISSDLGGGDKASFLGAAYLLAFATSLPILNRLSDVMGRKRLLLSLLIIFMLASLGCGLSQTMNQLIAFRVFQGIGVSSK